MTVIVGVDGAGRTHRLRQLADARAWWVGDGDLAAGLASGAPVVADDAHRLSPADLRAITAAARAGVRVLMARRPTVDSPELAALDEVAAAGGVEWLGPLTREEVGRLVATVTGRPVSPEVAASVHERSAGLPGVAAALAADPAAPVLMARVQRRFAVLSPEAGAVARVLALGLDLSDEVLASAAGVPDLAVLRTLRDEGLLVPGGERMIPAVADAVVGDLSAVERRRLHDSAAGALAAAGADPLVTAVQLRAARVRSPAAAEIYRQAGEAVRFTDPAAALAWFDDATEAGADPAVVAAGRAEASMLLGLTPDPPAPSDARMTLVAGAAAAHDGRAERAADLLSSAPPPGPLLAVPVLVATGRLAQARAVLDDGPGRRFADAVLAAASDPPSAVPLLIEAAELAERTPPTAVLPDTPHAVGSIVAVLAADVAVAEHLLDRGGVGGPAAAERHRLLLAWARMRAGRYDTALTELTRPATELPARERLLRAAIAAGMARRRGDIAGLRAVWGAVEPVLTRRAVDLWQLEAVEELLVAAARLRQTKRLDPIVDALEQVVARLGNPPAWTAALGWLRLQVAVAAEDPTTATEQAERLANIAATAPATARPAGPAGSAPGRPVPEAGGGGVPARSAGLALNAPAGSAAPEIGEASETSAGAEVAASAGGKSHGRARTGASAGAEVAALTVPESRGGGRPAASEVSGGAEVAASIAPEPPRRGQLAGPDASGRPQLGDRVVAQCAAAVLWAQVLAGASVPLERVLEVTEQLVDAELPWEASRLAGQAAIHATDSVAVRRLLERARELSEPDSPKGSTTAQTGGLSERELAVAELVLAGSTHREIGAQLYIAPKTVEHHVARIRAKLGAGSRAELIATLREILPNPT